MAIVLGIGLGVATLIIMCLLLTLFVNRRERQPVLKGKGNSNDKLRKLDAVSPTRTLEDWWSRAKGPLLPSEGVDGDFVWYV
ncbi:hypothetical protein AbraIFM66951_009566 [Aspergillus brasiliensis]|uniref:Uncharacterized protein n=1 Tax=Aspergillus brasiliensis TaxID=319629 RepID=A0A9W5Z1R0_9EURO|nr:hypothetical protein AbraCBS73388_002092 [Aspergillus brasiliensis]GKZ31656.1 hypothetical protein AbraIFM66950_000345 [Aspergillus brasiliensis]GKZ41456.1 hypothetical protein AbraIFM66951_009566 [Aspergillus brasiliensis]